MIDDSEMQKLLFSGKHAELMHRYQDRAESGDMDAKVFIGWIYSSGTGDIERDYVQAKKWLQEAAEEGIADALYILGTIDYQLGDIEKAIADFESAAEKGYSAAYYQLGKMYHSGFGVAKNPTKAYELFQRGAELGHIFARREIAVYSLKGYKGLLSVPQGLVMFLWSIVYGTLVAIRAPYGERTFH